MQAEAKWATQIAKLEKEQGSLVNAMARREEEFSALQGQLESTQLKLSSTQASNRHPLGLTQSLSPPIPGPQWCIHGGQGLWKGFWASSLIVKAFRSTAPNTSMS